MTTDSALQPFVTNLFARLPCEPTIVDLTRKRDYRPIVAAICYLASRHLALGLSISQTENSV